MATVQQKTCLWFHRSKSIVTIQRRFRLEYRNCRSPSKSSIKRFKGAGNVHHRKGAGRPSVSDKIVERVRETFTVRNCSYRHLIEFLLGDLQFRYSKRKRL
ncbi:hypothetical protein AVEN_25414-1 [Araneus ventricosus]|uniref:DUF4817 domain-containing protein n=1 Tax=Araneus ventricosus TaxID=182803 RepID=A0A4Y2I9U3_ARAVE|nr:hypothetical protein AVEN_25414-1 [Araneus ventricosus]